MRPTTIHRALVAASILAGFANAAQAAAYDCTPLATEGKRPSATPDALNNKGQVAGTSTFKDNLEVTAAFWKRPDRVRNLSKGFATEPAWTEAHGLNDHGLVVGEVSYGHGTRPVLWQGGVPTELPLPVGGIAGVARAVNNKGRIVGETFGTTNHATLWRDGQVIDLGALGPKDHQAQARSYANFIGEDGTVVGQSQLWPGTDMHPVRWDAKGNITDLGALPGGHGAVAQSANLAGTVVGYSYTSTGPKTHAVAWRDGQLIDLGALTPGASSVAHAVNGSGVVVGYESKGEYFAALVWPSVQEPPQLLNALVANACGNVDARFSLDVAVGINASGAILAQGHQQDVGWIGFILTPR